MLASAPHKVDIEARALRERFELVVIGDDDSAIAEAARALFWFCSQNPEYVLCAFVPEHGKPTVEAPKRIPSKYAGVCKTCNSPIAINQSVYWTPGQSGVECARCGTKGEAK